MKILRFLLLTLLIIIPSGCGLQKVQYTNRTQLITMNQAQEIQLGLSASEKIKKENIKTLDKDKAFLRKIQKIGKNIAKVANKKSFKWEFHTISENKLNAFCLPGGKVFVYTGIKKAAKNDHQLATVISHEIAHALARHGAERASMGQIVGLSGHVLSTIINSKAPGYNQVFAAAYGFSTNYGLMLPYSRKHELEADKIGLILMKKAGYDTNEALKFWGNMSTLSKTSKDANDFFSTHPNHTTRIKQIKVFNRQNG
jgi:predicted Zn-dependent protease